MRCKPPPAHAANRACPCLWASGQEAVRQDREAGQADLPIRCFRRSCGRCRGKHAPDRRAAFSIPDAYGGTGAHAHIVRHGQRPPWQVECDSGEEECQGAWHASPEVKAP